MKRREFIKTSCLACMAMGAGVSLTQFSSCSPALPICRKKILDGKIEIDPSEFTEGCKVLLIRTHSVNQDILLVKTEQSSYRALLMVCTHNEVPLSPTRNTIICHTHGSEFDFDGNAKSGPAKNKLKGFPVTENNGKIIISLRG